MNKLKKFLIILVCLLPIIFALVLLIYSINCLCAGAPFPVRCACDSYPIVGEYDYEP
jgi:hypothetical protein